MVWMERTYSFFRDDEREKKYCVNVSPQRELEMKRKRPFYTLLLLIWLHCKRTTTTTKHHNIFIGNH